MAGPIGRGRLLPRVLPRVLPGVLPRVLAAGAAVAVFAWAAPADAHVTASGVGATQGGYATLTFKVPTESATARTVKLVVSLPTDHPIASVSVQPHAGWTIRTTTARLATPVQTDDGSVTTAVSTITWTATAGGIPPEEFDLFNVSAGPLPGVSSVIFPAVQTYSDGTVVKWIEVAAPGSTDEPEHPAPHLDLAPATGASSSGVSSGAGASSSAGSSSASGGPSVSAVAADPDAASSASATVGIVLGAVGVVLGAAALFLTVGRRGARG